MIIQARVSKGKYDQLVPITVTTFHGEKGPRVKVKFGYNEQLLAEIKNFDGARWEPSKIEKGVELGKYWHFPHNDRNLFQLNYIRWRGMTKEEREADPAQNPYFLYDLPLEHFEATRKVYDYQQIAINEMLTRHYFELAAEMGLGKTLCFIEATEIALSMRKLLYKEPAYDSDLVWYVGPVSGVRAVQRELRKWNATFWPKMMTYEGLVKMQAESSSLPVPFIILFDESSKIKTHDSQRSKAAYFFADLVRQTHGRMGYVWEFTGTPSPKSPVDWWHQLEVLCPGFLKEGTPEKFKRSLSLIEMRKGMDGGEYPHLITWLDNENKCAKCGNLQSHEIHRELFPSLGIPGNTGRTHQFVKSVNEVDRLYRRMKGIVLVQLKRDCLSLPEKTYEIINVQPTPEMLRAAKIVVAKCPTTIMKLTLLRELSDGFQYTHVEDGEETCEYCKGKKWTIEKVPCTEIDPMAPYQESDYVDAQVDCPTCGGKGTTPLFTREIVNVGSPKDEIFLSDLDEHEEIGRYIVWGGFTGTIDRLVEMAHKAGWATLCVDGRGFRATNADGSFADSETFLAAMDGSDPNKKELLARFPKICFVGNAQAGGMALTLTASPTAMYFSNTFSGEARMQSEDRGHRAGMDPNRGFRIKDLICLETDQLVLDNLRKKKRLQDISLGQLQFAEKESLRETY